MKRLISILAAIAAIFTVSCKKEPAFNETALKFDVTVGGPQTKAVKTEWTSGDVIYVFFDDYDASTASESDLNYLKLTYDGSDWAQQLHEQSEGFFEAFFRTRSSGSFDATFAAYGNGKVSKSSYSEGPYIINQGCSYYLTQTAAAYSVSDNMVSLHVELAFADIPVVQVFVEGLSKTSDSDWRLFCKSADGNSGLCRFEGVIYDPSNHSFTNHAWATPADKSINSNISSGGMVFYGLAKYDGADNLTFSIVDNAGNYPTLYFEKSGVTRLEGGMAIKLSYSSFAAPASYRTALYPDGTLVIDEKDSDQSANEGAHGGTATNVYASWHDNSTIYNGSTAPWNSEMASVKYVKFGSEITPRYMQNWFNGATGLLGFDKTNLNTSACTTMNSLFKSATTAVTSGNRWFLDLSGLDVSKVAGTGFQNTFSGATGITGMDISGWRPGTAKTDNLFRNMGNMAVIYADGSVDFSNAASSSGMFYGCSKLVGGNGTAFNSSIVDKTYACVDKSGTPGYFTDISQKPVNYRTALYPDGTLVIDERDPDQAGNESAYGGTATNVYDAWHDNASAYKTSAPWISDVASIKYVKFGSEIVPAYMQSWFNGATGLLGFDKTNLNTSACTTMNSLFKNASSAIPAADRWFLDLSGLDVSKVAGNGFQNTFSGVTGVTGMDISGWHPGTANTDNLFRQMGNLTVIYASSDTDFSGAGTSSGMFYNCTRLVGGNGTAFNASIVDKTYARVDTASTPGYFTAR